MALALLALGVPATAHAAGGEHLTRAMKADRAALARRLGPQAVVDVDDRTGTPRVLARLDGALTGPSARDPETIAGDYVRSRASALGLTAADVGALGGATVATAPGGVTEVRWRQSYRGIPASDGEVRVNVAGDGRVIDVLGSPVHDLSADTTAPALDAGQAVRAVQADVGAYRSLPKRSGPAGATRATAFRDGSSASLELVRRGQGSRLAWRVTYEAGPDAVYDAVVDARTGAVLRRVNMVKSDTGGLVWERYPGAAGAVAGAQRPVDLSGWLTSPSTLEGPNVHAWSDVDDDDTAAPAEEVDPSVAHPFTQFTGPGCDDQHQCSWNGGSTWETNRAQNAVQAFYFANRFHDHLKAPPIGFGAGDGNFEGAGKLELNTDDGAASGPDARHTSNANMYTPRTGSPRMQMYLFKYSQHGFREVNGGDDAAIVYHEYTHGLSNRLVTDAGGAGALNGAQAGAMGEAWSDWYAMDYLVAQGVVPDSAADGELDLGAYPDFASFTLRSRPVDCSVGGAFCDGYTYGDFGKISGTGPEVHSDGEIWLETLWDIRKALGSTITEGIVTEAMRLSPPEPSFLDERNAILQADQALNGGVNRATLWTLFARRGMGYFAGTLDAGDASPTEDTSLPPSPSAPKGAIAGTVTSADTGLPLAGVTVGIAGLMSGEATLVATTGADGRYAIAGVPAASYPRLIFTRAGWDSVSQPVDVVAGATAQRPAALRRDWAAAKGGAQVLESNHGEFADYGCGPEAAIDQSAATGWSSENPANPSSSNRAAPVRMVVRLPQTIAVSAFGMDPGHTCGDRASDSTATARVETATDAGCSNWVTAREEAFGPSQWGRLTALAPTAGATGVRCVRLSLLSSYGGAGSDYVDFSELAVFGAPPNALPSGTLTASPNPAPAGAAVHFDASGMTDPDSAIVGYEWDFGDGTTASTATRATDHEYAAAGRYTATVGALDFRGGRGTAQVAVTVGATEPAPAAPPRPAAPATRAPRFALPASGRRTAALAVTCAAACTATATLTADARTARRIGFKTLGAKTATLRAGVTKLEVALSSRAVRALRRHKLKSVTVTLTVTARYGTAAPVAKARRVKLRVQPYGSG